MFLKDERKTRNASLYISNNKIIQLNRYDDLSNIQYVHNCIIYKIEKKIFQDNTVSLKIF